MTEEIKIDGLDELDKKFKELDVITGQKVLRRALMWAATPMHKAMKESAPEGTDTEYLERKNKQKKPTSLKDGTKKWSEKADGEHSATVNVGYRMRRHWYAGLLELGTRHIAPKGWMRRAANQYWQETVVRFKKRLRWHFKKLEK
ncbi:MAG: HK97 gp10 family phage protein [Saccharospirillaceae bacterium]|nr:HK97 gp10 family phage protein [Saccharospirillaceae bacterium]